MKKLLTLIIAAAMMIGIAVAANAAFGVVVEGHKVDSKPNMEYIDESWGEPVASNITSATENTWLWRYWNEYIDTCYYTGNGTGPNGRVTCEPEDWPIDLYIVWDNKYLYVAFDVVDYSISGDPNRHRGDGIHLWVEPAEVIKDPTIGVEDNGDDRDYFTSYGYPLDYRQYIWTFDPSDWDCEAEGAAESCEFYINPELEDRWHAMIAIPWINLGMSKAQLVDGYEVAITFMRVSCRNDYEQGSGLDEGYSGGLCWGKYFMKTNSWGEPGNYSLNTLVLRDPATAGQYTPPATETTAPETDAPETDAPETEAPETDAPETDAPETDAPETDAPETDAPETDAPETDAPETEAPETEAPETEAPETEAPETDAPVVETDAPETDAPETDAPAVETDAPETDAPETDAPAVETDAPETDAPVVETDVPETDAPVVETDAPATDAPATPAEPAEKNNTGLIIGIACAVVVVGAVVGIVLGKKKKQ